MQKQQSQIQPVQRQTGYLIRKLTPLNKSRMMITNASSSPSKFHKKQTIKKAITPATSDQSPESAKMKPKVSLQTIISAKSSFLAQLNLSSSSWCLFDQNKSKFIGFRQNNQRQIASLTKIMTTILCIQFFNFMQIPEDFYVKVTENAVKMIGTTAQLKIKTWFRVWDLLYGTMLPSGNDAAFLLSQVVGYLSKLTHQQMLQIRSTKILDLSNENTTLHTTYFVKMMNKKAQQLKLNDTTFSNPHGLQNAMNTSSPKDILKLSMYASKNQLFRKIMNTDTIRVYYLQEHKNIPNFVLNQQIVALYTKKQRKRWWNTNNLLNKGWEGIKTGQTGSAGSCLSSLRKGIFIVVLNCKDNDARFTQTQRIYDWYINKKNDRQSTEDSDHSMG